ncbi:hypothetical protein I2F17_09270 [Acinetobacter sp. B10A]|uniref:hypothetical protein n=1 Tax=Acinetobacter baretiae TaxID=2605383 RepID=UPI001B3C8FB6|nr:hypothetical protein [Acinetobacter baretiae]MBF7686006.1 hypothetical protein [Acinetobacter baretiae]
MIDWKKEQENFHKEFGTLDSWVGWKERAELADEEADALQAEINDLKQQIKELHYSHESLLAYKDKLESGEFVLVRRVISGSTRYHIDNLIQANTSISDEGVNWMDSLPDMIIEAVIEAVEKDHE